jgi:hypothetical protein
VCAWVGKLKEDGWLDGWIVGWMAQS